MTKQNKNTGKLLQLIADNPDLEVLPLVNHDATSPDYNYTVAKWSEAFVDEYYVIEERERIYLRGKDWDELIEGEVERIYVERVLEGHDDSTPYEELEKIAKDIIKKYNWEKAIFVWIEPA